MTHQNPPADAAKKRNLSIRVKTSVIFVITMLAGVFGGGYPFAILFFLITLLCLREFFLLLLPHDNTIDKIRFYFACTLGMLPYTIIGLVKLGWIDLPNFQVQQLILGIPLMFLIFVFELFGYAKKPFHHIAYLFTGILYIGLPFSLLHFIAFPFGAYTPKYIISLLLITWINDTAAYLIGLKHGKTPLFPRISPKKTWEGLIGGFSIILILVCILSIANRDLSFMEWTIFALIVSTAGTFGDLIESMLKRSVKVKDSGQLLPGHGGFLDRFDGFLFSIPFAVAFLYYVLGFVL